LIASPPPPNSLAPAWPSFFKGHPKPEAAETQHCRATLQKQSCHTTHISSSRQTGSNPPAPARHSRFWMEWGSRGRAGLGQGAAAYRVTLGAEYVVMVERFTPMLLCNHQYSMPEAAVFACGTHVTALGRGLCHAVDSVSC